MDLATLEAKVAETEDEFMSSSENPRELLGGERLLLEFMAARLESQGVTGRSTILDGDLSRALAYALLKCGIEKWRPVGPEDIPLSDRNYKAQEGGLEGKFDPEELEDREKLRGRIAAYPVTCTDAEALVDCLLTCRPELAKTIPLPEGGRTDGADWQRLEAVNVILGFAFGNRFVADREGRRNGNREPGPINGRIAELVIAYYQACLSVRRGSPPDVFVQWEIADWIGDRIPCHSLYPEINREKDQVTYVTTKGALEIIGHERLGDCGKILVVAHPDHLLRCMWVVAKGNDQYYLINNHILPYGVRHLLARSSHDDEWYDIESGQLWTTRRHRCLIHEAIGRLRIYEGDRFGEAVDRLTAYRENLNRRGNDELIWQPKPRKLTFA